MAMEQRQDLGQPSNRKDGTPVWTGRSDEDKTIHARHARREIRVIDKQTKPGEYIPPAFPSTFHNGWGEPEKGMALRDYFAAKAMASMLLAASTTENMAMLITEKARTNNFDVTAEEWISESAYVIADAMLEARKA